MNTRTKEEHCTLLLHDLSEELKKLALWQDIPPNPELLASTAPFCCDTLTFEQWLQFVFIVKMRELVHAGLNLPLAISLLPMAEEAFKHLDETKLALFNVIANLDKLLSGKLA